MIMSSTVSVVMFRRLKSRQTKAQPFFLTNLMSLIAILYYHS